MIQNVCIFCGSGPLVKREYLDAAHQLGSILAEKSIRVNYGCGATGLMGALANGMLENQGRITGVIPAFMVENGWSNPQVNETIITQDMRERKKLMITGVDAVIALPGGIGTLEELMEVITLKQLGQFGQPVIILNTLGFYDHLIAFLEEMIRELFLQEDHRNIWTVVNHPAEVIPAITRAMDGNQNNEIYENIRPE